MSRPAIVPPSPVRSLEDQPYRKAAEQGDAEAQSRLGDLYANGIGVGRDYGEAAMWYRKSAEQGNPNGQHWLGHCYLTGRGVGKDETEALKWFREAANNGNIAAQRDLGGLYATGRGVEQNSAEAIKWYRKAAEAGLPSAQNDFAWMLATSTDASLRNGLLAVTFAEKAVTATRRSDASFLDTLAAAYAEAGDFEKAVAIQNEAVTLLKDAASKQDYTSRLRLYEAKTPYREAEKE
jgi:TPR repeat protein